MSDDNDDNVTVTFLKPLPWSITFGGTNGEALGKLEFIGDKMTFVGDADQAAQQFFDVMIMKWSPKIKDLEATIQKLINDQNKSDNTIDRMSRDNTKLREQSKCICIDGTAYMCPIHGGMM